MQTAMERSELQIFPETEVKIDVDNLCRLVEAALDFIGTDFGKSIASIGVVLLNDKDHTHLNIKHLDHHYSTDVLTFDLSEKEQPIVGEVYINMDVIESNAQEFNETEEDELLRVVIHGILHLVGLDDGTPEEKSNMQKHENSYMEKSKVSCETI